MKLKNRRLFYFIFVAIIITFLLPLKTTFALVNYRACLDYPRLDSIQGDKMYIEGWLMSSDKGSYIQILVDNKLVSTNVKRIVRDDVIHAIQGYGGIISNPTPGYEAYVDLSNYSNGNHRVTIAIYSGNHVLLGYIHRNFNLKKDIAKMVIDYPKSSSVYGDLLDIEGWIMSTSSSYQSNFYIDDKLVDVDLYRFQRNDVIRAIQGYGDEFINRTPGYKALVDISNLENGIHSLRIDVIGESGKCLVSETRNFEVKGNVATVRLDYPRDFIKGNSGYLEGWVMTTYSKAKLNFYVDNKLIDVDLHRHQRTDVIQAVHGYGDVTNNPTPGYQGSIDFSNFANGNHKVKVNVVSEAGVVLASASRDIYLEKYESLLHLDLPINNYTVNGTTLDIEGWLMSEDKEAKAHVYIDGTDVTSSIVRVKREDVLSRYANSYGGRHTNSLPGYMGRLDVSSYKDGEHTVEVKAISSKTSEVLTSVSRKIVLKKYESLLRLDIPTDNAIVHGTDIDIEGWLMSSDKDANVQVYIDGTDVTSSVVRVKREDVLSRYANSYGGRLTNSLPGYMGRVDVSSYKDGEHTVEVKGISSKTSEVLTSVSRKIVLKKYDGIIHVEYPIKSNFSNSSMLTISGWELSELDQSVVKIYLDNQELTVNRQEREDVLNAYNGLYGGSIMNATPGYSASISLTGYQAGEHNIKIQLFSKVGDLITSLSKKIYIYDHMYFGIDVSSYQGTINWDQVASSGIDFVLIRLGFGDNLQRQDDSQFLNNVNGAIKHGIPYGVYLYSYATRLNGTNALDVDSASIDSEVAHTLRLLDSLSSTQKGSLKLPVFIDMEDSSTISVGRDGLTKMADYYCSQMKNHGYLCGVYANKNWLNNYLDNTYLASKYDIWLAHYTDDYNDISDYNGIYQIWQYTSNGSLSGISSGGLDMNISFKKYW